MELTDQRRIILGTARELGPHGITANIVAPGFIRTEALEYALPLDRQSLLQKQVPVGRLGKPVDIGAAVAFLVSDAAGFINGAILDVNGGRLEYTYWR